MVDYPWFKFYPRDWLGNQALRSLSPEARGLCVDLLCLMHTAEPYGELRINGKPVPPETLSKVLGIPPTKLQKLLAELDAAGVFRKNRRGVAYSRKLKKDRSKAEKGSEAASRRWRQVNEEEEESSRPNGSPTAQKFRRQKSEIREEPVGSSAQRLRGSWRLSTELMGWTTQRFPSLPQDTIELEVEKFVAYWTSRGGASAFREDWDATWRGWALRQWGEQQREAARPATRFVRLHRTLHSELFAECEKMQGKPAPSHEWKFPEELVRGASKALQSRSAEQQPENGRHTSSTRDAVTM